VSCSFGSGFATEVTSPPVADTREIPAPPSEEKRITSSAFQVPPVPIETSHNVVAGPPEASVFFSLLPAKKAMILLSPDQKGCDAPFVPASAYASVESSDRTHSWTLAPVAAVKARRCPSGDTAMRPKLVLLGASSASFVIRSTSGWRLKYLHAKPRTSTSN